MAYDPYTAVWLSHSSITDFLSCNRLYYLKNIFKDPVSRRKINIASPYLSLGSAVHNTLEDLKNLSQEEREKEIKENLLENFKKNWQNYTGEKGGFLNTEEEKEFFERGESIIKNIIKDPKILLNKIIKENYFWERDLHNGFNPHFPISLEYNLVLNGAIDWLEYLEDKNSIRVTDFKTGRNDEKEESFQLPIYYLLIDNLDKKKKYKVDSVAYWYLDHENKKENTEHKELEIIELNKEKLEEIKKKEKEIIEIGKSIKAFRENGIYKCNNEKVEGEGCFYCRDFEKVYLYIKEREERLKNKENGNIISLDLNKDENKTDLVKYVGLSDYKQDLYIVKSK